MASRALVASAMDAMDSALISRLFGHLVRATASQPAAAVLATASAPSASAAATSSPASNATRSIHTSASQEPVDVELANFMQLFGGRISRSY